MSSLRLAMRASLAAMPAPARRSDKNGGKKRKRSKLSGSDRDRLAGGRIKRKHPKNRIVKPFRDVAEELTRVDDSETEEEQEDDYKIARRREKKLKAKAHRKRPRLTLTTSGSPSSSSGDSEKGGSLSHGKSSGDRKRAHDDDKDDSSDSDDDDSSSDSSGSSSSDSSDSSSSSSEGEGQREGQDISSSSSGESSDDEEEEKREDMHGVFDSERSSDDEDQPKSPHQKKKKMKRKKSSKSLSSQTSHATNDSITSHSHKQSQHSGDKKHRERKRISSNHSASSKHSKSSKASKGSPGRTRSVPPPKEEVIAWAYGMSQEKQRRAIAVGMRLKVRFMKPKMKWYGGVVTARSAGGKRIRIKYDDGTKEEPSFPDKEIVVDDEGNGEHSVSVHDFLPAEPRVPLSVSSRMKFEMPVDKHINSRGDDGEDDDQAKYGKDVNTIRVNNAQVDNVSINIRGKSISPIPSSRSNDKEKSQEHTQEIELNDDSNHNIFANESSKPTLSLSLHPPNVHSIVAESRNEEKIIRNKVKTMMKGESSPKRSSPQIPTISIHKKLKIRSRSSSPRNITITAKPEKKSSTTLKISIKPKTVDVKKEENGNRIANENKAALRTPQDIEQEEVVESYDSSQAVIEALNLERPQHKSESIAKDKEFEKPRDLERLESESDIKRSIDEVVSREKRSRSQSPSFKKPKEDRQLDIPSIELHGGSSADTTEMEDENAVQNQTKEKRKGGTSPLCTVSTSTNSKNEDITSRYDAQPLDERSTRRAAMKSKRIGLKEDGSTVEDQKQLKKRRRDKSISSETRRSKKSTGNLESGDTDVWVQCNRCEKWRLIPSDKNLPDKWYCELNVTDPKRNHCDAAEQTQEEVAKKKRKMARKSKSQSPLTLNSSSKQKASLNKQRSLATEEGGCASVCKGAKQVDKAFPQQSDKYSVDEELDRKKLSRDAIRSTSVMSSAENDDPVSDHEKLKGGNRRGKRSKDEEKGGKRGGKGKKQKEVKDQEWVQCERCEKWRRLPLHISAKDLPEKWYCSMNHWDPRSASCAVQEDHKNDDKLLPISPGGQQVGSNSKLSYLNLIKKPTRPISERVRAAESLFSSHAGEIDGENSGPPSVMYLNSSAFQQKFRGADQETDDGESRLFNYMNQTKLWSTLYQISAPDNQVFSLKKHEASISTKVQKDHESDEYALKTMVYFVLGTGTFSADEVLLACQVQNWNDDRFTALKASFTIESVVNLLNLLERNCLVESVSIENEGFINATKYKRSFQPDSTQDSPSAKVSKHSKPWKYPVD